MGKNPEGNGSKSMQRKQPGEAAASRRARRALRKYGPVAPGTDRRDFLKFLGVTSASLGVTGLSAERASGASGAPGTASAAETAEDPRGRVLAKGTTTTTLFFNLSHLSPPPANASMWIAGRKYPLTRTPDAPQILADARRDNAFLALVPDDQITHHAVGVETPNDIVKLGYVSANENAATGTWDMPGMFSNIPQEALAFAYRQARLRKLRGTLPLSSKRKLYSVPPARTLRDLQDEAALIDITSYAATVVSVHPDILSVEPMSAAHIQTNYISQDSSVDRLAGTLRRLGPATPEGSQTTGWATLKRVTDSHGNPGKKSDGLNAYRPDWDPQVAAQMASALVSLHPQVKQDPILGSDVTGYNLNDPKHPPPSTQLTGRLWARHDGVATIDQLSVAAAAVAPQIVFTNQSAETGLVVSNPTFATLPDGRLQVTFDNVSNWFLRWLGVWVQFRDDNNQVIIPLNQVEHDTYPAEPGSYPRGQDLPDAMFLGVVSPALTLMGIPIEPGSFSPTINMPAKATSIRIFYTGLGFSGSNLPENGVFKFYEAGILMTAAFNYATVGFFMAVGTAADFTTTTKLVVSLGGGAVAAALSSLSAGVTNQSGFIGILGSFTTNFLKLLFNKGTSTVLTALFDAIIGEIVEAEVLDCIPVAGAISQAIAAVVGGVQLAETTLEVALSPPAYVFDCVPTHNLSVTFLPEQATFPSQAGYTLYRKVSYLFDNGTAHTLDNVTVDPGTTTLPITFFSVPFGGRVNISLGLYMRKDTTPAGQNDWCAGYATTGLTSNLVDQIPPPPSATGFVITQTKRPIDSQTTYIHTLKTVLDQGGDHVWQPGSSGPPFIPPGNGQTPSLGGFNGITVRQSTAAEKGYVGYAWQAYSTGVLGCDGNAPGQFDQMANVNMDPGNAQDGYANTLNSPTNGLCGFNKGVTLAYNLLSSRALNIYLDTDKNVIRQIDLNPPTFFGPTSNKAFGQLNLPSSTRCLLHPAGHIVSINQEFSKFEIIKLPLAPVSDNEAMATLTARTFAGPGALPGLMDGPIAAAISPDGAIVVLEDVNNRIQAFDLGGNPVPYFKNQPVPYFLELTTTPDNTYLDLALEFTGYIYVISLDSKLRHRLDIYHPLQKGTTPICTTMDVNGANIAVDFWRNLYSLNYEILRLPNGNFPSFSEPSVSVWTPSVPA